MGNDIQQSTGYKKAQKRINAAERAGALELDLSKLSLTTLPPEIGSLTTLERLFLHGNDGLGLTPEVLGPTWEEAIRGAKPASPRAILDYYFRISTQATTVDVFSMTFLLAD